eukprot:jgi/Tetstr1/421381/TSEL_012350.t1
MVALWLRWMPYARRPGLPTPLELIGTLENQPALGRNSLDQMLCSWKIELWYPMFTAHNEAGKKGICGLCGLSAKLKTCECGSGLGFCLDCLYVHMQVPGEYLFAELSQMYPKENKAWLKDRLETCDHVPLHVAHAVKQ